MFDSLLWTRIKQRAVDEEEVQDLCLFCNQLIFMR